MSAWICESVNRRVTESLVAAGALDSLEGNRAQQFEALDMALRWAQKAQEDRERGQISLFGGEQGDGGAAELGRFELPDVEEWDEADRLRKERELLGFYLSGHPLHRYANDLQAFAIPLASLEQLNEGMPIRVGGLVTRVSDFERPRAALRVRYVGGSNGCGGYRLLFRLVRGAQPPPFKTAGRYW